MDLISGYGSEDSDENGQLKDKKQVEQLKFFRRDTNVAPNVDIQGMVVHKGQAVKEADVQQYHDPTKKQIYFNPKVEHLYAPVQGPSHPSQSIGGDGLTFEQRGHWSGHVSRHSVDQSSFYDQYHTFDLRGYAVDPDDGQRVVGDVTAHQSARGDTMATFTDKKVFKNPFQPKDTSNKRAKKDQQATASTSANPYQLNTQLPWTDQPVRPAVLTKEQEAYQKQVKEEQAAKKAAEEAGEEYVEGTAAASGAEGPAGSGGVSVAGKVTITHKFNTRSYFHGKSMTNYAGASWLDPPKDIAKDAGTCFLPKQQVHVWAGHSEGVNAIRFIPRTGHVLLSAGNDSKIKLWQVAGGKKCMRTYAGHTKGVRDICFSNDGRRFVSCGYDRNIRYWDTETGACLQTININRVFYVVKLHPDEDKQGVLMAGCQDKKIYQYDLENGECVTQYDYHLGAVNTITFIDNNRQFVSTSDDKTIRVWEYGVPVQTRYIADPSMHSIPAVCKHPNNDYLIGQSLDNRIITYAIKDKFKLNKKKVFTGHFTSGYACQVGFSPDGRYVISGDAHGRCFFWDWLKPQKYLKLILAHEGKPCVSVAWNPVETSKVATAGWDGSIKYWD